MHEAIRPLSEIRPLADPLLVAAFTGFTDQSGAATLAVRALVDAWRAQPLAEIEPERFYDFTVQRPRVRLEDGERVIDWPENRFWVARPTGATRDVVLLAGVEPHLRWRTFTAAIEDVLRAVGSTTSITLGAQPAGVPHTRPLPVTLSASDAEFETIFGLSAPASRYQGPTGIVGVLNLHLRSLGWKNASLWGMSPHYINAGPNPQVALSLIPMLDRALGTHTDVTDVEAAAEQFVEQLREVLGESGAEAEAYVRQLEEQYDAQRPALPAPPPVELPSPGELLSDLEQFLRDQRRGEPGQDT